MTAPRQYYDDGLIQLDREAITLRRYHFPSGTSKIIPLRSIRGYKAESLGLFTERFRIWGSTDPRRCKQQSVTVISTRSTSLPRTASPPG